LQVPASTSFLSRGKYGIHGEHLRPLLAEMQYLQRAYPNCDW
jgi:ring-1,2-phenylacetyl-CoA epoxidase subunit PaaC